MERPSDITRGKASPLVVHRAFERSDLLPVYALLWFASLARVIAGFWRHETFGTLPTLALLAIVLLPLLVFESWTSTG